MPAVDLKQRYGLKPVEVLEHSIELWQARYSPCGRFLIGAGYDATVLRWAVDDAGHKPLPAFKGHDGWLQCVAFTGHDDRLVSADSWGRVSCWKYSASDAAAPLWTKPAALAGWVRAVAIAPNGRSLAVGGSDHTVRILNVEDGSVLKELVVSESGAETDTVFSLAFHPAGKSLAVGDLQGRLREFDTSTGQLIRTLELPVFHKLNHLQECGGIRVLAFDRDGTRLLCGGMKDPDGGFAKGHPLLALVHWADGKTLQEVVTGADQDGFLLDAWFHPDGFVVGTASAFPGQGKLFYWQPGEPEPVYPDPKLNNGFSVSLHPDARRVAFNQCVSTNGNGRAAKDAGEYLGGRAKIHILTLAATG